MTGKHGGAGRNQGRKPALSESEKNRAGEIYNALLRGKAVDRAGVAAFGEEDWQRIEKFNAQIRRLNKEFRELPENEKAAQRGKYWAKKQSLREALNMSQLFEDNKHADRIDEDGPGGLLVLGGGRGRSGFRFQNKEASQKELLTATAARLSQELGRPITPTAVKNAVVFHRAATAKDVVDLKAALAKAAKKIEKANKERAKAAKKLENEQS